MYISQINIDNQIRTAKRALSSPQVMHAIIEKCFETSEKKLWRLDGSKLLVVSDNIPSDPDTALQLSNSPIQTKNYDLYLSRIKEGERFRFRLTANPVRCIPDETNGNKRGKVVAHVTPEHQMNWLHCRAKKLGFEIDSLTLKSSEFVKFHKGGHDVTLKLATFEGVLSIKDAEIMLNTMKTGIGRGKAYGAGLITLAC